MTAFIIKLIAILTMIIDHVGVFFFPHEIAFRLIGRISFPLFAWLIANGAYHTRNINIYLLRLFILACISQVPYLLANKLRDPDYFILNAVFTLSLGLLAIIIINNNARHLIIKIVGVIGCAVLAYFFSDYGEQGVLSVVFFYLFFKNMPSMLVSQFAIIMASYIFLLLRGGNSLEPFGVLALPLLLFYNKKEGIKAKYLFYIFYPLHYFVIYCLLFYLK